jgi:hypothetical protein
MGRRRLLTNKQQNRALTSNITNAIESTETEGIFIPAIRLKMKQLFLPPTRNFYCRRSIFSTGTHRTPSGRAFEGAKDARAIIAQTPSLP